MRGGINVIIEWNNSMIVNKHDYECFSWVILSKIPFLSLSFFMMEVNNYAEWFSWFKHSFHISLFVCCLINIFFLSLSLVVQPFDNQTTLFIAFLNIKNKTIYNQLSHEFQHCMNNEMNITDLIIFQSEFLIKNTIIKQTKTR